MITLSLVLLLLALVCFVVAAAGPPVTRVNLTPLGLAFWVLSLMVPLLAPR